jgi:hypothetical protein
MVCIKLPLLIDFSSPQFFSYNLSEFLDFSIFFGFWDLII